MEADWAALIKEAEATGIGQPVPVNDYDVIVHEATAGMTATSNKHMLKVKFRILTGAHAGRFLYNNLTLSTENPKAMAYFFRDIATLGVSSNEFASMPHGAAGFAKVAQMLVGKQVKVTAGVEEFPAGSGKMKNNISGMRAATPGITASAPGATSVSSVSSGPSFSMPGSVPTSAPSMTPASVPTMSGIPTPSIAEAPGF